MSLFDRFNLGAGFKKYFQIEAASNERVRDDVFRVRHEVYCEELKFEPERPDRRETDRYDSHSVHCLLRGASAPHPPVGCTRLVLANPADLAAPFPVDPARVFMTGNSRGAKAAFFLACKRPGLIRAIAAVTMTLPDYLADDCAKGPPLPLALLVGTEDPIVPLAGGALSVGGEPRGTVLSLADTLGLWKARHHCPVAAYTATTLDAEDDGTQVVRTEWTGCREAPLVLYEMVGAGHTWPSGLQYLPEARIGRVSREIDGSVEIWRFFSRF